MSRPLNVHVASPATHRSPDGPSTQESRSPSTRGSLRASWNVVHGGRVLSRHRTQEKALAAARRIARLLSVDLVTHGRDGRIRSKDSHGNESAVKDTER